MISLSSHTLHAIAFAVAAVVMQPPQTAGQESMPLRVLSYNIHHGLGVDGVLDLERIAKVIRESKADLVALQEVDRKALRSGQIDQAAELARLTGMHGIFGPNIPLQGGQYGNAILSRYEIIRHQNILLPNTDGGEQRGVLVSEIKIHRSGLSLSFLATHFDHRRPDRQRLDSVRAIEDLVKATSPPHDPRWGHQRCAGP